MKRWNIGWLLTAVYGGIGCSAPVLDLGSDNSGLKAAEAPATSTGGGETGTSKTAGEAADTSGAGGSPGSAGTFEAGPGETVDTSGASGGSAGTFEAGPGEAVDTSGAGGSPGSAGTESSETIPDFLLAHCDMEARCVSRCSCPELEAQGLSRECPCAGPTRIAACPADAQKWFGAYSDTAACRESLLELVECMNQASCPEVQAFLKAHPDGVVLGTPCYDEYHALNCADYEPLQSDGRY